MTMHSRENLLPPTFVGHNPGNGGNATMYGQNPPYPHLHGSGITYGFPSNANLQHHGTQAGMDALSHAFSGFALQDGTNVGGTGLPASAVAMTAPPMSLIPGHGSIQGPHYFLIKDGILYARADIAPYACLQAQPNLPTIPGRSLARNMQPQGPVGFVGNVTYIPVTPPSGVFPQRREGAGGDPPALDDHQISVGSHSDGDHPSSPETPDAAGANKLGPRISIAGTDASPAVQYGHSTPSPCHYVNAFEPAQMVKTFGAHHLTSNLLVVTGAHPAIPRAVPTVSDSRKTLHECFDNPTGTTNVYIRGLHPETTDDMLYAYAARFGQIANSKAMIDNQTGACKGYGFACFHSLEEAHNCIRGFYHLGYEVSFARESFNARLKSYADPRSTNLYVSNLPRSMTDAELKAVFSGYKVISSRIIRDAQDRSKGVGFARFSTRAECDEVIKKYHGQPIGQEQLLLQVRYADTPEQKRLKHETQRRREFRANEYNAMAYGGSAVFPFQSIRSAGVGTSSSLPDRVQGSEKAWADPSSDSQQDHVAAESTSASSSTHSVRVNRRTGEDVESRVSGSDLNENASVSQTSPTIAYGDTYSVANSALANSA